MKDPRRYTVWVGGTEVNDHYLTLEEAKKLEQEYKDKGHDDALIDEKVGTILASTFIEWYLSDDSDVKDLGRDVRTALQASGYFNITIKDLYDKCGYIPQRLCDGLMYEVDEEQEFDPSELIFIDDITEVNECHKCHYHYKGDLDYCPNCGACVS